MDELNQTQTVVTETTTAPQSEAPLPGESPSQRYERLYGTASQAPAQVDQSAVLAQRLQELNSKIDQLAVSQTQAAPPPETRLEWVNRIQKGDFEGAQQSIADYVKQQVTRELQPQLQQVRQQAFQEASTGAKVEVEVANYLNSIRASNPDIAAMEPYLEGPVTKRLQLAQQAGRITNPQELIREYKAAVDGEVANLRSRVQQIRGAGKDEAMLRNQQVLSSIPLTPQQVQSQLTQGTEGLSERGESNDDYFTRRQAESLRRRGMA